MNLEEYERMYESERSHFWFRSVREVVLDQVRALAPAPVDVLDVGCGTGGTLNEMPTLWWTLGVDLSPEALRFAAQRGHRRLVRASAERLPLPDARFDLAFALDVIEHCPNDDAGAAELFRVLRPGGLLVATVPAFQALFGPHDVALQHQRRYRRAGLGALLERAGFSLERLTYFNTLLFAPSAAVRLASKLLPERRAPRSDVQPLPRLVNELLYRVFHSERALLRGMNLPIGLSILAVARRP